MRMNKNRRLYLKAFIALIALIACMIAFVFYAGYTQNSKEKSYLNKLGWTGTLEKVSENGMQKWCRILQENRNGELEQISVAQEELGLRNVDFSSISRDPQNISFFRVTNLVYHKVSLPDDGCVDYVILLFSDSKTHSILSGFLYESTYAENKSSPRIYPLNIAVEALNNH